MNAHRMLLAGLVFLLLAVALGAFGAHALKSMISAAQLQIWKTASSYHFYHALGLVGLAIWSQSAHRNLASQIAGWCFILGICLFSGSLYLLALTGQSWLGMLTPLGGLLFMAGWVGWIVAVMGQKLSQ